VNEFQLRIIIAGLIRVIERLCTIFCKNAEKIPEVVAARAALTTPIGE